MMITDLFRSKSLFQVWFGVGAPVFFFGSMYLAVQIDLRLGLALFLVLLIRVWDSFRTTCRRCGFYGTWKCGLPGKIVTLFFERERSHLSKNRIYLHYIVDLMVTLLAFSLYAYHGSIVLLLGLIWPAGAVILVFGPRRFHGLLPQLKNEFQV